MGHSDFEFRESAGRYDNFVKNMFETVSDNEDKQKDLCRFFLQILFLLQHIVQFHIMSLVISGPRPTRCYTPATARRRRGRPLMTLIPPHVRSSSFPSPSPSPAPASQSFSRGGGGGMEDMCVLCFFVLCNRHWFNKAPGPDPRGTELGVAYLPSALSSDAGYADRATRDYEPMPM